MSSLKSIKAFTLIEIMASLMIFAIGGTLALSFFSFHTSSRIELEDKIEAYQIADNVIKTLMLQEKTGLIIDTSGASDWKYPSDHQYKPGDFVIAGHEKWNWVTVPLQTFTAGIPDVQEITGANTVYEDVANGDSKYEYGYCVVDNPKDVIKYIRSGENFNTSSSTVELNDTSSEFKLLTVVVTWPRSVLDKCDRRRVLLSTLLQEQ